MTDETATPIASVELARRLRDAGLEWHPQDGDRFHIPDRDFGDRVWSISEMVIEPRSNILGERELAFNGTVEWALDSIVKRDVVWVPTEGQLRELLGESFIALYREDDGSHACVIRLGDTPTTFNGTTAPNAYGKALLATLVDQSGISASLTPREPGSGSPAAPAPASSRPSGPASRSQLGPPRAAP